MKKAKRSKRRVKTKAPAIDIAADVRRLEGNLRCAESVNRFILRNELEKLALAERLRRAAEALVRSRWVPDLRVTGGYTGPRFDVTKLDARESVLDGLKPFHVSRGRLPAVVRKALGK